MVSHIGKVFYTFVKSRRTMRKHFVPLQSHGTRCESILYPCKTPAHDAKAFCTFAKPRRTMRKHFAPLQNPGARCESILHLCKAPAHDAKALCTCLKRYRHTSANRKRPARLCQTFSCRFEIKSGILCIGDILCPDCKGSESFGY